jgi:hypothetical protein
LKKRSVLGLQLCNSTSLSGNDLTYISDRLLADLADGDAVVLDFPNNLVEGKKGKNRNAIITFNATGEQVTVTIRILKGSPDDKFFNNELNIYRNNKAGYILLAGEFIKRSGDGAGNIINEIFTMGAGFVQKFPNTKENVEGDSEQGVSIYQLVFMNTDRSLS